MRPFLVAGLGTLERKGFPVRWGEMEPISCSPCAESHVCMEGDKDCVLMSFREGMSPGGGLEGVSVPHGSGPGCHAFPWQCEALACGLTCPLDSCVLNTGDSMLVV